MITSHKLSSIEHELYRFYRLEIRASDAGVRTYLEGRVERGFRLNRRVQADPTLAIHRLRHHSEECEENVSRLSFPPTFGLVHELIKS
jgi:hypothetical protein